MADNYVSKGQCDFQSEFPVVDEKYFETTSIYEKCKCIDKIKSSLEILEKRKSSQYKALLDDYKNKYNQNNCADVFKNYIATNQENIYNSVTQEDKARIEAQSKKERNQRLFIGVAVFVVAIGIISIYRTRKS